MIGRRTFCGGALGGIWASTYAARRPPADLPSPGLLADLEDRVGGRLGVAILDTAYGSVASRRGRERFPLCSVGKLPTVACVLSRVDRGRMSLDGSPRHGGDDPSAGSLSTGAGHGTGRSLRDLCAASIRLSDNDAHNQLVRRLGGPAAVTAFVRSLGDRVSRFDRFEPELNSVAEGDVRDTTSPAAMVGLTRKLLFGRSLSSTSSAMLRGWMAMSRTGAERLRADVPSTWACGDKTGTGPRNATEDVAFLAPPGRPPIIVSAFLIDSAASLGQREAVLAAVGRLAAAI